MLFRRMPKSMVSDAMRRPDATTRAVSAQAASATPAPRKRGAVGSAASGPWRLMPHTRAPISRITLKMAAAGRNAYRIADRDELARCAARQRDQHRKVQFVAEIAQQLVRDEIVKMIGPNAATSARQAAAARRSRISAAM